MAAPIVAYDIRMEGIYVYVAGIATNLVASLMVAGGRCVRDEALGSEQERALRKVFEEATAAGLVEVARRDRGDQDLPERLAAEFGKFYEDTWVAETLVGFALSAHEPPVDGLKWRYVAVGNDPDTLPMDFEEAMRLSERISKPPLECLRLTSVELERRNHCRIPSASHSLSTCRTRF